MSRQEEIGALFDIATSEMIKMTGGHAALVILVDQDGKMHIGSGARRHPESFELMLALRAGVVRGFGAADAPGVEQIAYLSPQSSDRAHCLYCGTTLTVDEARVHMRACEKSPLAQELAAAKARIAQLEVELADALSESADVAPTWTPAPKAGG